MHRSIPCTNCVAAQSHFSIPCVKKFHLKSAAIIGQTYSVNIYDNQTYIYFFILSLRHSVELPDVPAITPLPVLSALTIGNTRFYEQAVVAPGRETARRGQMNFVIILFPRCSLPPPSLSPNSIQRRRPPFVKSHKTKTGKYLRSISPVKTPHA